MKLSKLTILIIAASSALLLSSCVDQNDLRGTNRADHTEPAGFFHGIWHGICAPFALIGIVFGADIGLYEPHNTGNWYNFGFLIGIGSFSSTGATKRRK